MDNQNFNNPVGSSPLGGPVSPLGGSVPEPPKDSSVDLRTMQSDIQSVKQSGGASAPEPKKFNLGEISQNQAGNSFPSQGEPSSPFNSPGSSPSPFSGNDTFVPSQNQSLAAETPVIQKSVDWKKIILVVVAVVLIALLGYAGYAYVYPLFFSATPENSNPVAETNPSANLPVAETNPVVTPSIITHLPYLNASSLGSLAFSSATFKSDLASFVKSGVSFASSTVSEVQIQKDGSQMNFSDFFNSIFPEISKENLSNYFENDFTVFIFTDADGESWPGVVSKLKTGANLFDAESAMKLFETASNFSNIFVEDPGTRVSKDFIDGQINLMPTRYITFTNKKAAIDYMWLGNYFIVSSSYPGLKAAVPLINP